MLTVADAPSIAAAQPVIAIDVRNLAVDGRSAASGPIRSLAEAPIQVGTIIVAKETGLENWHEAHVVIVEEDLLTLVWSGLPDSEVFTRRLWQVARLQITDASR